MIHIKILILDNNFDNIKYFKNTVKKTPYEVKNVYASLDPNQDILKLIETKKIDLIYLYARFYGINTFKIIKKISEKFPEVKIVFFGGVADGAYIKQFSAVNGIYSYTLPHREQNILNGIEFYSNYVQEQNQSESINKRILEKTLKNNDLFLDKFLDGIITGAIQNSGEILTSFRYFKLNLDEGYRIFVFRIDHYKKYILTLEEKDKHLLISKMKYLISNKMGTIKHVSFFPQLNEVVVIANSFQDLIKAINLSETIKEEILLELNVNITIGIGRYYSSIKDLYISYNEAVAAYNYRFQIGYKSVIPIEYVEPNNEVTHKFTSEKKSKLIYTTVMGECDYSKEQINKIFSKLLEIQNLPPNYPSKLVHSIIVEVDTYAEAKGVNVDDFYNKNVNYNFIRRIKNLEDAQKYLLKFTEGICNHITKLREDEASIIYENAKKFFDEYYYESFSISKVAVGLSVSADYLNSLFKKYSEESAYDYVQRKRLEKAKKLLREEKHDDAYIAAQVGFDSKNHFRNIFKLYENRTTDDYRKQYNVFYTTISKDSFKLR